ncbi:hypothetical protein GCM10029963_63710 [Micromonospora andamanensis]
MPEPLGCPADHDDAGVEEADQADKYPTEAAGGVPDQHLGGRIPGGGGRDHVRDGERARLGQPRGQHRGAVRPGDRQRRPDQPGITAVRLEATGLPAGAGRPLLAER